MPENGGDKITKVSAETLISFVRTRRKLTQKLKRQPTFDELAVPLQMSPKRVYEVNIESLEIANKVMKTCRLFVQYFNREPSGEDLCSLHEILKVERLNIPLELINEILQMSQEPMYLEPIMEPIEVIQKKLDRRFEMWRRNNDYSGSS